MKHKLLQLSHRFATEYKLGDREAEIAYYMILGYSNKEIANKLGISENTVKNEITTVFAKTFMRNRYKLQAKAIEWLCEGIG